MTRSDHDGGEGQRPGRASGNEATSLRPRRVKGLVDRLAEAWKDRVGTREKDPAQHHHRVEPASPSPLEAKSRDGQESKAPGMSYPENA